MPRVFWVYLAGAVLVIKRDALRRGLLNQEEADAWRRALVQLVGERAASGGAMMADQATV